MRQHEQAVLFVRKAAEDEALLAEVVGVERISNQIFGFHAQQSAEKLLKALLSEFGIPFSRTHNLRLLMDLLTDAGQTLPSSLADLDQLTAYGTLFRYEDIPVETKLDRMATLEMVRTLRVYATKKIGS